MTEAEVEVESLKAAVLRVALEANAEIARLLATHEAELAAVRQERTKEWIEESRRLRAELMALREENRQMGVLLGAKIKQFNVCKKAE